MHGKSTYGVEYIHSYVNVTLIKFENDGGDMYSNVKLQDCLVRFFFFQRGGACLREEKMG